LKQITEAYEALSEGSAPEPASQGAAPESTKPAPPVPDSKFAWRAAASTVAVLLVLYFAVRGVIAITAPFRNADFMQAEALRLAKIRGPGISALDSLSKRASHVDISKLSVPANGAELVTARGKGGLGEFHLFNEERMDCVVLVFSRQ